MENSSTLGLCLKGLVLFPALLLSGETLGTSPQLSEVVHLENGEAEISQLCERALWCGTFASCWDEKLIINHWVKAVSEAQSEVQPHTPPIPHTPATGCLAHLQHPLHTPPAPGPAPQCLATPSQPGEVGPEKLAPSHKPQTVLQTTNPPP